MTKDLFHQIFEAASADKKENLNKIMKPFMEAYSSKEGIERIMLNELSYFHGPYGAMFKLYDTVAYEEVLPNLLGGTPLKANGIVYFKHVSTDKNNFMMVNELAIDKKDALKMVEEMMNKVFAAQSYSSKTEAKLKEAEMKKEFAKLKMDIKDYSTYSYDQKSSWPIAFYYKRNVLLNTAQEEGKRINELSIEPVD